MPIGAWLCTKHLKLGETVWSLPFCPFLAHSLIKFVLLPAPPPCLCGVFCLHHISLKKKTTDPFFKNANGIDTPIKSGTIYAPCPWQEHDRHSAALTPGQFEVQPVSVEKGKLAKSTGAFSKWGSIPNSGIPTFHLLSSCRNRQSPTDVPDRLGYLVQYRQNKHQPYTVCGIKHQAPFILRPHFPCKWNPGIARAEGSLDNDSFTRLPSSLCSSKDIK